MTYEEKKMHFVLEDNTFIEMCNKNKHSGCTGCRDQMLCEELSAKKITEESSKNIKIIINNSKNNKNIN